MFRTAVIVPCFKRPEYTKLCIEALESAQVYRNVDFYLIDDGSCDGTEKILTSANLPSTVVINKESQGLRNVIIDFFDLVKDKGYDYIAKMDNDCVVPKNWLNDLVDALIKTDSDIVSPNVVPSNAAFLYGRDGDIVRPSETVGGLWCMKSKLISGIDFDRYTPNGISGAFNVLKQIIIENEAKCGWVPGVTVEDIGHWSGAHPKHIKSQEHEAYSAFVGRPVAWNA